MATYVFTNINDPSAAVNSTNIAGINDAGQIVGGFLDSSGISYGFVYSNGSYTTLTDPAAGASSGTGTGASGINATAEVVGSYSSGTGAQGYLYDGGTYTNLTNLGSVTLPQAINAGGQIVGYYVVGTTYHGFFYSNGTYTTLDDPHAGSGIVALGTLATGINDAGQIVGVYEDNSFVSHYFLYSGGAFTTLPIVGAVASGLVQTALSYVSDININDNGQIAGNYQDAAQTEHGFLYSNSNGTYITLTDPSAGVGFQFGTVATGINAAGEVAGYYVDSSGAAHGFVYDNGTFTDVSNPSAGVGAGQGTFLTGINATGEVIGNYVDSAGAQHDFLATLTSTVSVTPQSIQNDFLGITRTSLPLDQATTEANAINAGTTTEAHYVNGLLSQVADTTIPVVGVEASMYGAVGSSAVITNLVTNFLPGQLAYAQQVGLDLGVYACLETSLVFAFANETGNTGFANNYGPSNPAMPATAAGDAAFSAAAATAIFGSAQTANTANALLGYVDFLEGFFTANGIVGVQNPTADQIVIAARAGAWGEGIAIALENHLGALPGQVTNFLEDAAQGTAIYSTSLSSQPTAAPFQGAAAAAAVAATVSQVQVMGVTPPSDHIGM